jgi:hypothetical protein
LLQHCFKGFAGAAGPSSEAGTISSFPFIAHGKASIDGWAPADASSGKMKQ